MRRVSLLMLLITRRPRSFFYLQVDHAAPGTLFELVCALQSELAKPNGAFASSEGIEACIKSIDRFLPASIAATDFHRHPGPEEVKVAFGHIEACIETGNVDLLPSIVQKLSTIPSTPPRKELEALRHLLFPLFRSLQVFAKGKENPVFMSSMRILFSATVTRLLNQMGRGQMLMSDEVAVIVDASITFGEWELRDRM